MKRNKLFLYSLSSLAVIAASAVSAEEIATAPSLEGGFSAMIGGFWMVPSVNDQAYNVDRNLSIGNGIALNSNTQNIDPNYDFGFQAAIGYVFDGTANGIELSYRNLDSSSSQSQPGGAFLVDTGDIFVDLASDGINANQSNQLEDFDLMISQFLDIGQNVQMRFLGGVSYLSKLNQGTNASTDLFADIAVEEAFEAIVDADLSDSVNSNYSGWGPRVGLDARYDFGGSGFGIVGGASAAYFLGSMDTSNNATISGELFIAELVDIAGSANANAYDTNDNHAVTNLRANLGIDYVYYFQDRDLPTLGLELGYEVDSYLNGVSEIGVLGGEVNVTDITFSGPYINLKGVF